MTDQLTLPDFEGQRVSSTRLKVLGIAGDPMRGLHVGETVYVLAEVVVESVEHPMKDGVMTRLHKGRIRAYGEMDVDTATELLHDMKAAARRAAEDKAGIVPLFRDEFGNQIGVAADPPEGVTQVDPDDDENEDEENA